MERPFDIITEMKKNGRLKILLSNGHISPKVILYHDLCSKVDGYTKQGINIRQAVINVSIIANVCERTVWRAVKSMRSHE